MHKLRTTIAALLFGVLSATADAQPAVTPPAVTTYVKAEHPEGAAGREAAVELEVVVGEDGRVRDARVLTPVGDGFDEAALAAIIEVCSQHLHDEPAPLSTRGVKVPAELEAVVLACLDKDPERRPQTAKELRRRLIACGIEPWTSDQAHDWWKAHQGALDGAQDKVSGTARTIMIDGALRS